MQLHVLATGCPDPAKSRFGSAFALRVKDDYLMFDCGPAATYKLAQVGIRPTQVNWLFFTHHHFDHNVDYPCFLLTRWDQESGKEERLKVFGPPPTCLITERLIGEQGAFYDDWKARIDHPASHACHQMRGGSLPRPAPCFDVADVAPGPITEHAGWSVKADRVHHVDPYLKSLAYRVDSDEGSIVFAGDAGPCPEIPALARGADALVIACGFHQDRNTDPRLSDVITGSLDIARIAAEAEVKELIITHTTQGLARPGSREKVVADVSAIFQGKIVFPDELMTLDVP